MHPHRVTSAIITVFDREPIGRKRPTVPRPPEPQSSRPVALVDFARAFVHYSAAGVPVTSTYSPALFGRLGAGHKNIGPLTNRRRSLIDVTCARISSDGKCFGRSNTTRSRCRYFTPRGRFSFFFFFFFYAPR